MELTHLPLLAADGTAAPLAPISAAVVAGELVFVSGQAAIDTGTGSILGETVEEQAAVTLDMLAAVLERAGASLPGVVRAECYLARREDFAAFNGVWAERFPGHPPARTTVVCAFALAGLLVEVQAVAVRRA